ncbi:hypothetical protein [Histidinibacterium aquaticum]|uniref:Uncharacterized protein n=1 Tax=Histidinibacterium aquaticum TaxID=2613962 RepID=A0A5J5GQB5_9RHOB|nr:hypothetical protein [Histidinibacterium aquaticum]KAA9010247.1 hypothetical protein F3S47_03075 [Histidinibacterium aquaticum]
MFNTSAKVSIAALLSLALTTGALAQDDATDNANADAQSEEEVNDETGTPGSVADLTTTLQGGAANPDEAFDGLPEDTDVTVVRLSEIDGSDEDLADLDAELSARAEQFIEYHRQIADRDYLASGIADAGYNVEDVVAWFNGPDGPLLIVDDRNRM